MTAAASLTRGDRAPDMVLPAANGTPTRFYAHAGGRPTLLVLADDESGPALQSLAEALSGVAGDDLTVHVVGPPALAELGLPFAFLQDAHGRAAGAYRTSGSPTAFLLDRNLRVHSTLPLADGEAVADAAEQMVRDLAWDPGAIRQIATQAPLLVVPDVLNPEQCEALVRVWDDEGHEETGVETSSGDQRAEQISSAMKRRTDHVVTDPQRSRDIATMVGRRVMPEITRAFAYRATRFEGFKIACYEAAERGFFSPHRDNLSPSTAHRRFALTLNLSGRLRGRPTSVPRVRTRPVPATEGRCVAVQLLVDARGPRRHGRATVRAVVVLVRRRQAVDVARDQTVITTLPCACPVSMCARALPVSCSAKVRSVTGRSCPVPISACSVARSLRPGWTSSDVGAAARRVTAPPDGAGGGASEIRLFQSR